MRTFLRRFHLSLAGGLVAALLAGCGRPSAGAAAGQAAGETGRIKLGFLVQQPAEPWFQFEWKGADRAAAKYGFEVIELGVPDGEKVIAANILLTQHPEVKRWLICALNDTVTRPALAVVWAAIHSPDQITRSLAVRTPATAPE